MDRSRYSKFSFLVFRILISICVLFLALGWSKPNEASASAARSTLTASQLAFVTVNPSSLAVVDRTLHTVINTIDLSAQGCTYPDRIKINPVGSQVFILCQATSNLVVINIADLSVAYTLPYSGGGQNDITFNRNGNRAFISTQYTGIVHILDTATHQIIQDIPTGEGWLNSLEMNPEKDLIYVVGGKYGDSGSILLIDMNTFEIKTRISFGSDVWDIVPSSDGEWLYASNRYGAGIAIINATTNTIETVIQNTGELTGLALSPDGKTLYAGTAFSASVKVFDLVSRTYVTSIPIGGVWVRDFSLDFCGNELYVGSNTSYLSVVNTSTYTVDYQIPVNGDAVGTATFPSSGICLSPNGQSKSGPKNTTLHFVETLKNASGAEDTFTLSLSESTWPAVLSTSAIGPLADGAEATFSIDVTIPPTAAVGSTEQITITATSTGDPSTISAIALITGKAVFDYSYLPIIMRPMPCILGRVTVNGAAASGVSIDLNFYDGSNWTLRESTTTAENGKYVFGYPPALQPGQKYSVSYHNNTDPTRLYLWFTNSIMTYNGQSIVEMPAFDIANITLGIPASGSTVSLPYIFTWTPRSATPTDSYEFNIYDPNDYVPYWWTIPPLGYVNSYRLTSLPSGFEKGAWYTWYVAVYSPDGGYGESYYSYWVKFQ